jgi:hypothetical protein
MHNNYLHKAQLICKAGSTPSEQAIMRLVSNTKDDCHLYKVIELCHKPKKSIPRPNTFTSNYHLILFFHVHLDVFEIFRTQAKIQHAFYMRATFYTHRLYPPCLDYQNTKRTVQIMNSLLIILQ